jgi:hypothetical protein
VSAGDQTDLFSAFLDGDGRLQSDQLHRGRNATHLVVVEGAALSVYHDCPDSDVADRVE